MRFPNDRGGRLVQPNSLWQLAMARGICPGTVYSRIQRGWEPARALETPVAPKPPVTIAYAARAAGMHPDTVRHRMNDQGMTLEQATHRFR